MEISPFAPPVLVADEKALLALADDLARYPAISVDTESNSLFAYRERVCLIQFSTPDRDYILDPICFSELNILASIFANPQQQKVFHAAEYDILCLKRDYGFSFAGIFDSMIAARTLGWPHTGLGSILKERFDVQLSKKHQRANWGKRPLTAELIDYAQLDTHYLLRLRDLQSGELKSSGRWEEAHEEFDRVSGLDNQSEGFDPGNFWKITGSRDLSPTQAAILRELYCFREQQAMRADVPPFKIMEDRILLEITKNSPRSRALLKRLPGMTPGQMRRFGDGILIAVQRGLNAPHPGKPRHERAQPLVRLRYEILLQWRKDRARKRGVESDVIFPRDLLWTIANRAPKTLAELDQIGEVGPWRRQTYGPELIELLNESSKGHK